MKDFRVPLAVVLQLLLAMAVSPSLLTAQSGNKGQLEIGAFGVYSGYDETNIGLKPKLGAGAWAGFYVTDNRASNGASGSASDSSESSEASDSGSKSDSKKTESKSESKTDSSKKSDSSKSSGDSKSKPKAASPSAD